jgi:tetratricopeptide (TPR) repeat protein
VAIARELDDRPELALALFAWGTVCIFYPRAGTGDLANGRAYLEEAERLFEAAGDAASRASLAATWVFHGLAWLMAGDLPRAETQFSRGLELARATGYQWYVANALNGLGLLALAQGDSDRSRIHFEQALTHHRAIGDRFGTGAALTWLGDTLRQSGHAIPARAHYAQALQVLETIGHVETIHQALCGLAELALEAGEPAHALRLVSVASAQVQETGTCPSPPVQARLEQVQATTARRLSAGEQEAAWAAGQTLPLEQVIAEALADVGPGIGV